jgi:hypothetical protein
MKTPRTDAALDKDWTMLDESLENVANVSRQLERELEELKDVLKLQQKSLFTRKTNNIALDRRNKRLVAALEYIAHADLTARQCQDEARRALGNQNATAQTPPDPAKTTPGQYTGHVPCKKCGRSHWMYGAC